MDSRQIPIRDFSTPVLLVGGGTVAWDLFSPLSRQEYPVIAVDGGANPLMDKGIVPDLVIGDMDSVSSATAFPEDTEFIEISEQHTTDFEKSLYSVASPLFICFGFWGNRLDHSLAALHVLTKYRSLKSLIMVDDHDLLFIPQGQLNLNLPTQTRISVIPLTTVKFEVSSGLKYPLEGLTLENGAMVGVSNETTTDPVSIIPTTSDADNYGVVMSNQLLPDLLQQLEDDLISRHSSL